MKRRKVVIRKKRVPARKPARPTIARRRVRSICANYLLEPHPELM